MTCIPDQAFADILEELKARPITINKYRDVAGSGRSQSFGLVNKRCMPCDHSRQNWIRPKLFYHLQQFAKQYVDIPWTSITVNQDYKCQPHRDKGNQGETFLVAFGDYQGGELVIHEGDLSGTHDIRCKPIKTDFSKVLHSVKDFTGHRYSLVFYTLKPTKMPKEPIPKGEAVFEDGKYVFKRGGVVVNPKEGLGHPLKGRKKVAPMIQKTSGEFIVTFD